MRNPILAAILSLIVAGLGQIYNGQIGKGVIFIVIQLVNGALTGVLIGWILLPIVGIWAMIDAYMTAKHNNERYSLRETSLARLSTLEAELNRSQLALEKIIQEATA